MNNDLILDEILKQNLHWDDPEALVSEEKYRRRLYFELLKYLDKKQILSIVGLRRTGKTTIMGQIARHLIAKKEVEARNIFFISFDEALVTSKLTLASYLDAFLDRSDHSKMRYVFIDEIQYIEKWQHILKRYYDTRPLIKFIVSGSSSLFIRKKTTESLAGRIYDFELSPLSFGEYLAIAGVDEGLRRGYEKYAISDLGNLPTAQDHDLDSFLSLHGEKLKDLFEDFLLYYQFPEAVGQHDKKMVLRYIEDSIYKKTLEYDIPRLFDVDKVNELKFVFRMLVSETGNELELGKVSSEAGIELNTLKKYLEYLQESLLFSLVYNYSRSVRKSRRLQKKGYIACTNFFSVFHPDISSSSSAKGHYFGKLVETYAYSKLAKRFEHISFYKKGQKEVDFICSDGILSKKGSLVVEVKYANRLDGEDFTFVEKVSKEIFNAERFLVLSKSRYEVRDDRIVWPCFLLDW